MPLAPTLPKDRFHGVYILFYWLGIGSLMPWNFFLAVNNYWMYKFRNTTIHHGNGSMSFMHDMTELQLNWGPYMSMAAMIPNVSVLLLNAVVGHRFRVMPRLLLALGLIIALLIFSDVMTQLDTDLWQHSFFYLTLFTVVLFNVAVAIFQGGLSGIAGHFPPEYMGSVVQGQALGGLIAAAINVLMLALGANDADAAFWDFLIATIFLATALVAFAALAKSSFYKYHMCGGEATAATKDVPPEGDQLLSHPNADPPTVSYKGNALLLIIRDIWIWILAVFVCFFVTLALFPSLTRLVFSTQPHTTWGSKYFVPVGCFLLFSIGDYVGRCLASWIMWPRATAAGAVWTLVMSVSRLAFIPVFLFCNASPNNRSLTDVYFYSDTVYLTAMLLFSITNGYIGTICMMFAPKMVSLAELQGQAASLMLFFLVFGLAIGSAVSVFIIALL